MLKGYNKAKQEEECVLGICYKIASSAFLNIDYKFPRYLQYCSESTIDDLIYENKKGYVNLEPKQVRIMIFELGDRIKENIDNEIMDYYIIE